jgi:hypothetical protein
MSAILHGVAHNLQNELHIEQGSAVLHCARTPVPIIQVHGGVPMII